MNNYELEKYFDALGIPSAGRELIRKARCESPVRKVKSAGTNVMSLFQSQKMGGTMAAESLHVEFSAMMTYDKDPEVLEFYPQPVYLEIPGDTKRENWHHTPDFLVLRKNEVAIEEWRQEKRLITLAKKYPQRYQPINNGWASPPVENLLANLGIRYDLRSADEHNQVYIDNLNFLRSYFREDSPEIDASALDGMRKILQRHPVLSLKSLIGVALGKLIEEEFDEQEPSSPEFSVDDIYSAIAHGHLTFDLYTDRLADMLRSCVYANEAALSFHRALPVPAGVPAAPAQLRFEPGFAVSFEGQRHIFTMVGAKNSLLQCDDGRVVEMTNASLEELYRSGTLKAESAPLNVDEDEDQSFSEKQINDAMQRQDLIARFDKGLAVSVSIRTIQRWKRTLNSAQTLPQQITALAPPARRGNFSLRLADDVVEAINVIREKYYNEASGNSKIQAFRQFSAYCSKNGVNPCSERTFNERIADGFSLVKREGTRNAYKVKEIVLYLEARTAINGLRPFELVHIDHTPLEIIIKNPENEEVSKSVWLSLAIDAHSRAIVGFYLTPEPPSYKSCMMTLRSIVQRNGRMPDVIVVDNGKEFHSHSFQRVCKLYKTHLRYRPKGNPRFGSVMERVFLTTQTQFIHNLKGNTKLYKDHRAVTKAVNPKTTAEWTFVGLHGALTMYFDELYGVEEHPAHGLGPVEKLQQGLAETGLRNHTLVRYDRLFKIETCPAVTGDTRVVDPQRGVKVSHIFYWSDAFKNPKLARKKLHVREDPWDPRYCYVLVNDAWHTAKSKFVSQLQRCSALELHYAIHDSRKKYLRKGQLLTPELLIKWTYVTVASNFDVRLRAQGNELRKVYEDKGLGSVEEDNSVVAQTIRTQAHEPEAAISIPNAGAVLAPESPTPFTKEENDDEQFGYF